MNVGHSPSQSRLTNGGYQHQQYRQYQQRQQQQQYNGTSNQVKSLLGQSLLRRRRYKEMLMKQRQQKQEMAGATVAS